MGSSPVARRSGQGSVDQIRAVLRQNRAAVARLVTQAGTAGVQHHAAHGQRGAALAQHFHPLEAHESGRSRDSGCSAPVGRIRADRPCGPTAGRRSRRRSHPGCGCAPALKREVEEAIGFETVAAEQAGLARIRNPWPAGTARPAGRSPDASDVIGHGDLLGGFQERLPMRREPGAGAVESRARPWWRSRCARRRCPSG